MGLGERSEKALEVFLAHESAGHSDQSESEGWNDFIVAVRLDGGTFDEVYDEVRRRLFMADFPEIGPRSIDYMTGRLSDGLDLLGVWERERSGE
jgi:hypothetical protein